MLIAIVILSALLFFAIMFAVACLVHAKYTTSMFKIEAEYAQSLEKANESLRTNQENLIENHIELMNRFNNLAQWTINQGLCAEHKPTEDADNFICLEDEDYLEEDDGCLLVDSDLLDPRDKTVDVSVDYYHRHYKRYRVRADKGPNGDTILEPTGYEYDEEEEDDGLENVQQTYEAEE
jgi:hypothetical protein